MFHIHSLCCLVSALLLVSACGIGHPAEPVDFVADDTLPALYPDYVDVTVPANIAPLNFMVDDPSVEAVVARVDHADGSQTYGDGRKVIFDLDEWREMCGRCRGSDLRLTLYSRSGGKWHRHPSFKIHVAADDIDPWLSYRLIEPSYVAYELIDIMQRDLTSFDERVIVSNHIGRKQEKCLNCHSYQNFHTQNMLFHVRGAGGGTMLIRNGAPARLMTALRRDSMLSNPVYPAWHPTRPLIAFSTNHTGQFFHTQSIAKVEVQDAVSELVLYDVERDSMLRVPSAKNSLDNFPTWSPDGSRLYYTSAHYVPHDTTMQIDRDMANHYQEVQYNLCYRDFDSVRLTLGEPHLLLDLQSMNRSATLPRVSPDGRYVIFACGQFGCFHIWHPDADIRCLDLRTMTVDSLADANSPRAESYPTWSSNGRWIIFASRRDDGNYSRVCIARFDADGHAHKAFALPHADPEHDRLLLRSYNRPEPMVEPAPMVEL